MDCKVEVSKQEVPSCMSLIEVLHLLPVFQVSMVCEYSDGFLRSLEEYPPVFKSFDDCQEFFVVGVIVLLGISE